MSLTGQPLFVLLIAATLTCPVLLSLLTRRSAPRPSRWLTQLLGVVICQVLAVATLFIYVNNQYGFYESWSDLLGRSGGRAGIQSQGLTPPGTGRLQVIRVPGSAGTNGSHDALVWLPPQYQEAQQQQTRFPVLMVLPGQPSTPEAMFRHYNFGTIATAAIASKQVKPFVAVFPPLMTNPPRDTECTDVPGGPQAETWLSRDVYQAVRTQLRVDTTPWTMLGWSTGGFCAAKLLMHHPAQFRSAASFGGYYTPITDHTTGSLFGGQQRTLDYNSPTWLYQHGGLHKRRLLVVVGLQDHNSHPSTARFLKVTKGDPGVSKVTFPTGGHNYHNYRSYLPDALQWLQVGGP